VTAQLESAQESYFDSDADTSSTGKKTKNKEKKDDLN